MNFSIVLVSWMATSLAFQCPNEGKHNHCIGFIKKIWIMVSTTVNLVFYLINYRIDHNTAMRKVEQHLSKTKYQKQIKWALNLKQCFRHLSWFGTNTDQHLFRSGIALGFSTWPDMYIHWKQRKMEIKLIVVIGLVFPIVSLANELTCPENGKPLLH